MEYTVTIDASSQIRHVHLNRRDLNYRSYQPDDVDGPKIKIDAST